MDENSSSIENFERVLLIDGVDQEYPNMQEISKAEDIDLLIEKYIHLKSPPDLVLDGTSLGEVLISKLNKFIEEYRGKITLWMNEPVPGSILSRFQYHKKTTTIPENRSWSMIDLILPHTSFSYSMRQKVKRLYDGEQGATLTPINKLRKFASAYRNAPSIRIAEESKMFYWTEGNKLLTPKRSSGILEKLGQPTNYYTKAYMKAASSPDKVALVINDQTFSLSKLAEIVGIDLEKWFKEIRSVLTRPKNLEIKYWEETVIDDIIQNLESSEPNAIGIDIKVHILLDELLYSECFTKSEPRALKLYMTFLKLASKKRCFSFRESPKNLMAYSGLSKATFYRHLELLENLTYNDVPLLEVASEGQNFVKYSIEAFAREAYNQYKCRLSQM